MFLADFGLTRCELPKSPNVAKPPQAEAGGSPCGHWWSPKTGGTLGKERGDIKWIRISQDVAKLLMGMLGMFGVCIWDMMQHDATKLSNVEPATIMIYLGVCIHTEKNSPFDGNVG